MVEVEEGEEEEEVIAMRAVELLLLLVDSLIEGENTLVVGVVGEDWAWGCGIPLMGCMLVVLGVVVVGNGS